MMNMANRNGDAKQLAGNVERMKHLFSLIIVLTALSFTSVVLAQRTIRIGEGNFTAPYFLHCADNSSCDLALGYARP